MRWDNVFHEGELKVQERAGEQLGAEANSAMISDKIMSSAFNFIRQQQMVVVSSRDRNGQRWVSLLFGPTGFLQPVDKQTLQIRLPLQERDSRNPLWTNLPSDRRVGILIIELATRRRIRINGEVTLNDQELTIAVSESFPNCPKYITRRPIAFDPTAPRVLDSPAATGSALSENLRKQISKADTLFLGTGSTERSHDASHRGGNPGFIEIVNDRTIRIPDFPGNSLFNSLGNLETDNKIGLVIPFFENANQLEITGTGRTIWDSPDPAGKTGGTNRFVEFTIDRWLERPLPIAIRQAEVEYSPYNP